MLLSRLRQSMMPRSCALLFRYCCSKALSTEVCGSLFRRTSMVNGFHHNYFGNKFQIGLRHLSSRDLQAHISPEIIKIMEQRLLLIQHKAGSLLALMDKPEVSPSEFAAANKELSRLRPFLDRIQHLKANHEEISDLKSVLAECAEDKDMFDLASEELGHTIEEENKLRMSLLKSLLPKDDADEKDCILEVRAGAGGVEASLFAMEIFKMYERYSLKNGWKFEVIDINQSDLRGFKEASGSISGEGVYGKLKFEIGTHRVQRVPVTEKSGRIHTSTVTVAILPQADEVDVPLRGEDLRIDTYRSGGSGGQSVNTTDSAVRITHIPSGLVVTIQDERSQHKNKAKALKVLCARLYEIERCKSQTNRSKLRAEQIGSGDRCERIRTYNFPQGRVTDHRVGITCHSIDEVLQGESLDKFIDALLLQQEIDAIASFSSNEC